MYVIVPANSLPGFMPGYNAAFFKVRLTHGIEALLAALALFAVAWFKRYEEFQYPVRDE